MCVMEQHLVGPLGVESDVSDGRVPLQPVAVQALLLDLAAPGCVRFVQDAEFQNLEKREGEPPFCSAALQKLTTPKRPL